MSNISAWRIGFNKFCVVLSFFLILCYFNFSNAQTIDSNDINRSIDKSVVFLNQRIAIGQLYYLVIPVLIPVTEHYMISLNSGIYSWIGQLSNDEEKRIFLLYSSFFDFKNKNKNIHELKERPGGIDGTNLFSLYGSKAISKKLFYSLVDSSLDLKGYELTHAYLASLILKNTKYVGKKESSNLESLTWNKMKEILPSEEDSFYNDLEIESIAFALYGGQISSIKAKHISQLLNAQNSDGSWNSYGSSSPLLRDHTTVLVLWALLEWKYKDDLLLFLPSN